MTRHVLTLTVLGALLVVSCKSVPQEGNTARAETKVKTDRVENTGFNRLKTNSLVKEDVVSASYTNSEGKVLKVAYNNTQQTALLNFDQTIIKLNQTVSASGFWYENDTYELRGKGDKVTLTKDGKVVFEN